MYTATKKKNQSLRQNENEVNVLVVICSGKDDETDEPIFERLASQFLLKSFSFTQIRADRTRSRKTRQGPG
jgi:hypothetical protein